MPLPRCFFDISINGIPTGRVVFELFADKCPKTCQNFKYLCTGEKGEGKTTFKPLHYKSTPIHRIVKGFIIQGGDFENGDGSGGESVYGGLFKDENFKLKHSEPFLLSMANKGPNTNGSQYFITTRPAPHLDGVHVVFGRVVAGSEFVTEMENQKIDSKSRPYADVRIANCGELVLLKKGKDKSKSVKAALSDDDHTSSSSDEDNSVSSDTSSEEERRRRKKRRTGSAKKDSKRGKKHKRDLKDKKKRRKRKKKVSSSSSDSSSGSEEESLVTSTVNDGDIPPEISETITKKSWLYRYSKSPSPVDGDNTKKRTNDESTMYTGRRETVSSSGRMLKGRGNMRYRTPPPGAYNRYYANMDRDQYRKRSRSPDRDRYRKRSRSPDRNRYRKRSRSPDRDQYRKRSRSPGRDRYRKRSRSPDRDRYHKRSRSPDKVRIRSRSPDRVRKRSRSPDRVRKRSRSPDRNQYRERSRSPDRDRYHKVSNERNNLTDKLVAPEMETTVKKGEELQVHVEEDQTPPNYEQEEYWSNEVQSHAETVEGKRRGSDGGGRGSKWDRGVASSDEDTELTSAYQKVEQTLAEQQFGIGALIGENMK